MTGLFNTLGAFVMRKFLSRKRSVWLMGRAVKARLTRDVGHPAEGAAAMEEADK